MDEFSLIERYFDAPCARGDVRLGIGDDAALLDVPSGRSLAAAIDTLVEGVHFPPDTPPEAIGYKALAVNLSDLAAMAAEPAWATLALTLPRAEPAWLDAFAAGFFRLAERHGVCLVGGDTTRGPLTVTVQAHGFVDATPLRRDGARPGDRILVTGSLGDAGLGLRAARGELQGPEAAVRYCLDRLRYPAPRLAQGRLLHGQASAGIDVSDGLLADLQHLLDAGGVGAELEVDCLPRSPAFCELVKADSDDWFELPLSAGDDFELCVTVPEARIAAVCEAFAREALPLTAIGRIVAEPGLRCRRADGSAWQPRSLGWRHFEGEGG
ncbi:thiamine-phosphate kinase [Thiohalobacter sp. IOR34]|nr:thiamine-phosphate kinase [Thiohalobacter sp. IOR34]WJW76805.1 thiamine-phosphate kinase [Thiohalobacter sp. IOR34]